MNYSKLEIGNEAASRESTKRTKTVLFPLALEHQGKKNWRGQGKVHLAWLTDLLTSVCEGDVLKPSFP